MAHASQKLKQSKICKPSVRFDPDEDESYPMSAGIYINREWAAKKLGVKNLDKVQEIEVTVRIVK